MRSFGLVAKPLALAMAAMALLLVTSPSYGQADHAQSDDYPTPPSFEQTPKGLPPSPSPGSPLAGNAGGELSPAYYDNVDFYLHTIDVRNQVYTNFGHTTIRVHNKNNGEDLVYNWGMFNFNNDPVGFALKFFRGILDYTVVAYSFKHAMAIYNHGGRTVWQDPIHLTREQKKALIAKFEWNLKPENRVYPYQYFFQNCSTIPRDYIDEVLGGTIKSQFGEVSTKQTFRDMVMSHFRFNPEIAFSLNILMNGRIDATMSRWQKMFLPLTLRDNFLEVPSSVRLPSGEPQKLLTKGNILVEFERPAVPSWNVYWLLTALATVPMALMLLVGGPQRGRLPKGAGVRVFGFYAIILGLLFGLYGLIMPVAWGYSDHLDLHHNINQLLIWPTFIGYFFLGWFWLLRGRAIYVGGFYSVISTLCYLYIATIAGYGIAGLVGLYEQKIDLIAAFVAPLIVIFLLLSLKLGFTGLRYSRRFS